MDLTHYYNFCPFSHRYDVLSRLRHIEKLITENTNYLLGTQTEFNENRFNEEFELFGVINKIYHPDGDTLFKIKKLIYPIWLYKSIRMGNESPVSFTRESFEYCRNKYRKYYNKNDNKYKLFLTRYNTQRNITNFDNVHEFFKEQGFIILDGTENLETTINYFYNSEMIVGIHGGLFSNLLFCNNVKRIIEIFPSKYYNCCFIDWNQHLNTNYKTLTFESDINNNINFDQNMLNEILEKMNIF